MTGPGVESARINEIDNLAGDYVIERDRRIVQLAKEIEAKRKLIEALHRNAAKISVPQSDGTVLLVYRYDETTITLAPGKEKLKVANSEHSDDD